VYVTWELRRSTSGRQFDALCRLMSRLVVRGAVMVMPGSAVMRQVSASTVISAVLRAWDRPG